MNEIKVVCPARPDGKISAVDMMIALVQSGCPMRGKLWESMSAEEQARVKAAVAK